MHSDEQAIRDLFAVWRDATAAGDLSRLLLLMADDVTFLRAGQPPIQGKQAFAAEFEAGLQRYRVESHGDIRDLQIDGNLACCWTHLALMITPLHDGVPMYLRGDVLSILQKREDGGWVVLRDANMLAAEPVAPT